MKGLVIHVAKTCPSISGVRLLVLKLGLNFPSSGDQTDLIIMLMVPQFMAIGKIGRGQLNERRPHGKGWGVGLHSNNSGQSRIKETRCLLFFSVTSDREKFSSITLLKGKEE